MMKTTISLIIIGVHIPYTCINDSLFIYYYEFDHNVFFIL